VTATTGPGWIKVTFTPPRGSTPTGYELLQATAGGAFQPAQAPSAGTAYTFQVTGLSCDSTYSFEVAALYPGGQVASAPTAPVRPCVAPGAPQAFRAAAVEHGANLSWSPPANAGTSQVTYDLTWSGARSGSQTAITRTTDSVTGLANFQTYSFALTASNAAGSSLAQATTSASLVGPSGSYGLHNRRNTQGVQTPLHLDDQPQQGAPGPDIPANANPILTIICQVSGGRAQDPSFPNLHGNIWDKTTYQGQTVYASDLYVLTPKSAAGNYSSFSDPPLWNCD